MQKKVVHLFTKRILLSLLLILCGRTYALGLNASVQKQSTQLHPSGFISLSSDHAVIVEKETQKLLFYRSKEDTIELLKEYPCSTGQNNGDKLKSGDKKTPEGAYYFKKVYNDSQLPSKYGVMALVLDYPNYLDRMKQKSGNGIWLHGLDKPLVPFDTKGCIAINNEDLIEVSRYIELFDTPIVITEKAGHSVREDIICDNRAIRQFLSTWEKAWEGKRLESYVNCYSSSAYSSTQWKKWRRHKKNLNSSYKFIDIAMHNVNILKHDKTFIIQFLQDYESDKFKSRGSKTLYLQRNSDDLKIVGEDWSKLPPHMLKDENRGISEERSLCRLLNTWIGAWEAQRIDKYMDCYSRDFRGDEMTWQAWKEYKSSLYARNNSIHIEVIEPVILIAGTQASVCYKQKYVSDSHADYGLKSIMLNRENGSWKIVSESWERIEKSNEQ